MGSVRELARLITEGGAIAAAHLEAAGREQVAPLLGSLLEQGRVTADEAVSSVLARELRSSLAWSIVAERETRWAAELLRSRGIEMVLLKGAALARTIYRPGERFMSDVDVLVSRRRWREAQAALLAHGGRLHDLRDRPLTIFLDNVYPLRTPGGVLLEVHRALYTAPLFDVDHEALIRRSVGTPDGLRIPEDNDLFLALAIHATKHGFALPLRSFVDGLRLCARVSPDALEERARTWRARRATAAWLLKLIELGADARWHQVARSLAGAAALGRLARLADGAVPDGPRKWWRVATATDGRVRPLAWAARRVALRLADRGYRRARTLVGPGKAP